MEKQDTKIIRIQAGHMVNLLFVFACVTSSFYMDNILTLRIHSGWATEKDRVATDTIENPVVWTIAGGAYFKGYREGYPGPGE